MADSDEMHTSTSNGDFAEEKEDENKFGLLNPPPKTKQLQGEMIEQNPPQSQNRVHLLR